MLIGWDTTIATTTQSVRLDQIYAMIGSVNRDSSACEISFGSGTATDCAYTRELDTTLASTTINAPANAWSVTTGRETTTMSSAYYPFDNDNDTTGNEYAASANLWLPMQAPTSTKSMGSSILYSVNMRAGTTSQTMQGGFRDFFGNNATINGGWTLFGTTNAAVTFGYQDALTNGYFGNTTYQYVDTYNGETNIRFRTNTAGAGSAVRDIDFVMASLQWVDNSSTANVAPTISNISVNNGNDIILSPNTTTTVSVSYQINDNDGCQDVFSGGSSSVVLARSGAGSSCSKDNHFCYQSVQTVNNCTTGLTANVTSTFNLWYYADATDASSSHPGETWNAFISASDFAGHTIAASSAGVEVLTLAALQPATSSFVYPPLVAGGDTGSSTTEFPTLNVGNASITLAVAGTALSSGSFTIPTSSQHFASGTFTYGGSEQQLLDGSSVTTDWRMAPALSDFGFSHVIASYPKAIGLASLFTNNDYVYVVGGTDGTSYTSTVLYAKINGDGSFSSWVSGTPYPSLVGATPGFVYNNRAYVVGGYDGVNYTSTVRYANINGDGSLGAWATTTPYPNKNAYMPTLVFGNYAYVVGGYDGVNYTSTVRYAPIYSSGTIGTWATTTPLPSSAAFTSGFIQDGNAYVFGGYNGSAYTSTISYVSINSSTGLLGSWVMAPAYPHPLSLATVFNFNDRAYVLGGFMGTSGTSTIRYAQIGADGSLDAWVSAGNYPLGDTFNTPPALVYNGRAYVIGGNVGGSYTSTISYTNLDGHSIFWGLAAPSGLPSGSYSGSITLTAVYVP
jgi:predicted lipoprotein with Yx(FWY)xxD motif